jgi:nitrogen fixation protein FixH
MEAQPPRPSAGLWPYLWVIVIGAALIPNAVLLTIALRSNTAAVEDHPYEASRHFDELKQDRQRFTNLGLRLSAGPGGSRAVVLTLEGPSAGLEEVRLRFIRQADARLDRECDWADPSRPLRFELPAPGLWRIELRGSQAGAGLAAGLDLFDV